MPEVKRSIITTSDGSLTVEVPDLEVTYHSRWGALQESLHVFIDAGLRHMVNRENRPRPLRIFEMGLGTGLNALLTLIEARNEKVTIQYTSIEPFPLSKEEWAMLDYGTGEEEKRWFRQIHEAPWGEDVVLSDYFTFRKEQVELERYSPEESFHLIYYDAFAPKAQPLLWSREVFEQLCGMLQPGGVLVTYCSKSIVRRAMQAAGFSIQKIPGPKWKREMLRATRPAHTPSQ